MGGCCSSSSDNSSTVDDPFPKITDRTGIDTEEFWLDELSKLKEAGYGNKEKNIELLSKHAVGKQGGKVDHKTTLEIVMDRLEDMPKWMYGKGNQESESNEKMKDESKEDQIGTVKENSVRKVHESELTQTADKQDSHKDIDDETHPKDSPIVMNDELDTLADGIYDLITTEEIIALSNDDDANQDLMKADITIDERTMKNEVNAPTLKEIDRYDFWSEQIETIKGKLKLKEDRVAVLDKLVECHIRNEDGSVDKKATMDKVMLFYVEKYEIITSELYWRDEMKMLKENGFTDTEQNMKALLDWKYFRPGAVLDRSMTGTRALRHLRNPPPKRDYAAEREAKRKERDEQRDWEMRMLYDRY